MTQHAKPSLATKKAVPVDSVIMKSRNYSADLTAAKKQLESKPSYETAVAVQRARINLEGNVDTLRRKICLS